jgi:hypothetical protein
VRNVEPWNSERRRRCRTETIEGHPHRIELHRRHQRQTGGDPVPEFAEALDAAPGGIAAISAALIAPIDTPAPQVGARPASAMP